MSKSKIKRPPGPTLRSSGQYSRLLTENPIKLFSRLTHDHGDISYLRAGPVHVYCINHPDLIRDVLVTHNRRFVKSEVLQRAKRVLGEGLLTSEGDFHLRQRRLMQPAFHRERIVGYAQSMVEYAARTNARWEQFPQGETADMSHEMMLLTLAIVGKTLFDADVEADAKEIGHALDDVMDTFDLLFMPFGKLLERLPLPRFKKLRRACTRLDEIIFKMIADRRREGTDRGDLLSMLLLAQDEDNSHMTDRQVRDEAMTIFLAGHETTVNALMWTWYLLSQNAEAEAQLHRELDEVLGDRLPGMEDVERLPYTRQVFAEAMRLYPPAWALGRRAIEEHQMGEYIIPKGSIVLMSQYLIHRDARFYEDPERFDPERWTPEAQAARPKYSYFPFSYGTRQCIGEAFAWTEGILLLATLAKRWRAQLVPGHQVELKALITLRARNGMPMTLTRR